MSTMATTMAIWPHKILAADILTPSEEWTLFEEKDTRS
jgi:hypothetical protein